jgi:putative transposase
MVSNDKLPKIVRRDMMTLSHYKFKQRLQDKCNLLNGCHVEIVNEAYTSQCCGKCGKLKIINGDDIYKCICGYIENRDINGARNIYLKYVN